LKLLDRSGRRKRKQEGSGGQTRRFFSRKGSRGIKYVELNEPPPEE